MRKFTTALAAIVAMCTMTQVAHAQTFVDQDDIAISTEDNGYIIPGHGGPGPVRPNPRPEPYPGGPGHGGPVRPNPRPEPYPGPGYPPPPPPAPYPGPGYPPPYGRVEYIRCESNGYNYQECLFSPYYVARVNLVQVHSNAPCNYNDTFGIYSDRVWVTRGCRATFEVVHY